jgi:hypothetical protein
VPTLRRMGVCARDPKGPMRLVRVGGANLEISIAQPEQLRCTVTISGASTRGPDSIRLASQDLKLEATPQPLGGVRWWLRCFGCGGRCATIYLAPPAPDLRCRRCCELTYMSQRVARADRLAKRAMRLARTLGSTWTGPGPVPPRPKGMHRARYTKMRQALAELEAERDREFVRVGIRLLRRAARQARGRRR